MNINSVSMQAHQPEGHINNQLTVLIVDDSKVIRLALNKILRNDFVVIQANDGEDAWNKLKENSAVSAIFSDVSMPILDGFGLLERVRSSTDDKIASLPFIIITANDDDPDFVTKVKKAGANDLITKPFKTNEITSCINDHIIIPQPEMLENSSIDTDKLADEEVANIFGLERNEQAVVNEQIIAKSNVETDLSQHEFTIDEDFFNDTAVIAADSNNETGLDQHEFTIDEDFFNDTTVAATDSNNETGLDQHELAIDEDFFNDTTVTATDSNNETGLDQHEFTIDEDFFNDTAVTAVTANESKSSDTIPHNTSAEVVTHGQVELENDSLVNNAIPHTSELNLQDISTSEFETSMPVEVNSELSLEIEFEPESTPIDCNKPVNHSEPQDIKLGLEQARKRAMDIAREQAESLQHVDVVEDSRRAIERSQILAELQMLREKEIHEGSYAQDDDCSMTGKITSFFRKFVRIISKSLSFRKK